jgi:uncharacterized protein YegL
MAIFQKPVGANPEVIDDVGANPIKNIGERHVACVLLLDTSTSMQGGNAIGQLNQGLHTFKKQTVENVSFDKNTANCIDLAILTFGSGVNLVQDFIPMSEWQPSTLVANGATPMGEAINKALELTEQQKDRYKNLGTPYWRPWIICITDGQPTDDCSVAKQKLQQMESDLKVLGYCVGVDGFNVEIMKTIFNHNRIFELANHDFVGLFEFLSSSLVQVRNSTGGTQIDVEAPSTLRTISMAF